jgi:N-acetylmuramoyl-L-alanine amidase
VDPSSPSPRPRKQARQRRIEELPLFAPKPRVVARPPRVQQAAKAAAPARKTRRRRSRIWIAVLGLLAFLAGLWLIVPRVADDETARMLAGDFSQPTIVVDAGHGGHDNGAARNGLHEKALTLDTALRLEKKLRARGFAVVLTRRDDRFIELADRSEVANKIPHALFVSIHFNDNVAATGEGVETYYATDKVQRAAEGWTFAGLFRAKSELPPPDNGLALARAVQGSIVGALKVTDRGVKSAGYAVVRHARCAAVLVEGGFINNPAQAKQISQPSYRETLAAAIADGIMDYERQRVAELRRPRLAQAMP